MDEPGSMNNNDVSDSEKQNSAHLWPDLRELLMLLATKVICGEGKNFSVYAAKAHPGKVDLFY